MGSVLKCLVSALECGCVELLGLCTWMWLCVELFGLCSWMWLCVELLGLCTWMWLCVKVPGLYTLQAGGSPPYNPKVVHPTITVFLFCSACPLKHNSSVIMHVHDPYVCFTVKLEWWLKSNQFLTLLLCCEHQSLRKHLQCSNRRWMMLSYIKKIKKLKPSLVVNTHTHTHTKWYKEWLYCIRRCLS